VQTRQHEGRIHRYARDTHTFFEYNTHKNTYTFNTKCLFTFTDEHRRARRTTHARDAAGAAPNLGAIYHSSFMPLAFPIGTPASSARNVPVGWLCHLLWIAQHPIALERMCVYTQRRYFSHAKGNAMAVVPPDQMMWVLHTPFDPATQAGLRWADLAMLRDRYTENPTDPRVHVAQTALVEALRLWHDDDVRTFLVVHFAEPPLSEHFQSLPDAELRQILAQIYDYLFADELES
jgi:hypothetical protein